MRVTAHVDYTVRAARELALEHPPQPHADDVAERQGLPLAFSKQILARLRRAGIARAHRAGTAATG